MKKRIFTLALAVILALSLVPSAAALEFPNKLDAPYNAGATKLDGFFDCVTVVLSVPQSVQDLWTYTHDYGDGVTVPYYGFYVQVDWSINSQTDWKCKSGNNWSSPNKYGSEISVNDTSATRTMEMFRANYDSPKEGGYEQIAYGIDDVGNGKLNLTDNTIYMRARFAFLGGYEGDRDIYSDWTPVFAVGKNATAIKAPEKLDPPVLTNIRIDIQPSDNRPLLILAADTPESVKEADNYFSLYTGSGVTPYIEWNINGGGWKSAGGFYNSWGLSSREVQLTLPEDFHVDGANVKVRVRYEGGGMTSPWSNVAEYGAAAWDNASDWAIAELEKADELGLIPDSLKSADLTKPITRAEFAAVSVKVYENLSGTKAIPAIVNPFTDTTDIEVLKAYNLGITAGTSADKFSPDTLLSREQAATMLTRVFKRVTIPGWTLATDANFALTYTKPPLFADDAKISAYAKDSVYFMVANGIINGTGGNMFSPRATTPAEVAKNYASATREAALIIAVRMAENLKDGAAAVGNDGSDSSDSGSKSDTGRNPAPGNSNIDEFWIDNEFTRLIPKPWEGTIAGFLDTETIKLGSGGFDYDGIEVSMTKITEGDLYIQKCREMGWIVKDADDLDTTNELFSYLKIYNKQGYDMSVYYNKQAGKEIGTLLISVRRAKANTP
jgi:hypothetical protein